MIDLANQRLDVNVTVGRAESSDWPACDASSQRQQLADDDATTDQLSSDTMITHAYDVTDPCFNNNNDKPGPWMTLN